MPQRQKLAGKFDQDLEMLRMPSGTPPSPPICRCLSAHSSVPQSSRGVAGGTAGSSCRYKKNTFAASVACATLMHWCCNLGERQIYWVLGWLAGSLVGVLGSWNRPSLDTSALKKYAKRLGGFREGGVSTVHWRPNSAKQTESCGNRSHWWWKAKCFQKSNPSSRSSIGFSLMLCKFLKPSAQLVSSPTLQVLSQSIGRPCQRSGGVKMDPQVPFLVNGESTSIPSLELSGSVEFHSFSEGPYGWRLGGWDAGILGWFIN